MAKLTKARRLIEGKYAYRAIAQAYLDQCEALLYLIARLDDFENGGMSGSGDDIYTQWAGHVVPAIVNARKALGSPEDGQ